MKVIIFQVDLFFFLITITIGLFHFIANPVIVVVTTVLVLEVCTIRFPPRQLLLARSLLCRQKYLQLRRPTMDDHSPTCTGTHRTQTASKQTPNFVLEWRKQPFKQSNSLMVPLNVSCLQVGSSTAL